MQLNVTAIPRAMRQMTPRLIADPQMPVAHPAKAALRARRPQRGHLRKRTFGRRDWLSERSEAVSTQSGLPDEAFAPHPQIERYRVRRRPTAMLLPQEAVEIRARKGGPWRMP